MAIESRDRHAWRFFFDLLCAHRGRNLDNVLKASEICLSEYVIPAVVSLLGTSIVWFTANFLGEPLKRFCRLRDKVQSSLIFYANVSPVYEKKDPREHPDWDHFLEAGRTLRELASELKALALNHPRLGRLLGACGYQLEHAASGLIGYANTLADPQARRSGEVAANRDLVERSLRLHLTYSKGVKI